MNPTRGVLLELRAECLAVADEIGRPRDDRLNGSPLTGFCAVVAVLVQGMFGGDLLTALVTPDRWRHYWNRLPDGREVDLTSCQFGGNGFDPLQAGAVVRRKPGKEVSTLPAVAFGAMLMRRMYAKAG